MKTLLLGLLVFAVTVNCACCWAQRLPKYDLGGASRPNPDLSFRQDDQYKRVHQTALRYILRGDLEAPETFLQQYLADHPRDAETHYMLGLLHAQQGRIETAERDLQQAITVGLPEDRLLAGPREMLKPLAETDLIQQLTRKFSQRLVHGPLVGNVSDSAASFWVRTAAEREVEVIVRDASNEANTIHSSKLRSQDSDDYTAVVRVEDLQPGTEYHYEVRLDGQRCFTPVPFSFRTFAKAGEPAQFTIAFGGGAGYVPENERMWNTIGRFDPQAILLLGDNVYIDDPESVIMQQYTYHRRQSRPEWRGLTSRSAVFTIWDDHDFGTNDSWGGADVDVPFWKQKWVFPTFRQNWANPGYGGGDALPGCWYSFQIADVDFFMLDCRYYRTNPRQSPTSMLGPQQKQWLKEQLSASQGTFKILCSSVPWDFRTKGDSHDTWNGYKQEHEEILSFIETQNIEGVVLMSADRHRSDAWKLSRPRSYDLYEFNSSRLTNQHVHPTMEKQGAIFSFNKPQSFGLVHFDTTATDPQVTYDVIDIDGKNPHSLTVRRSELRK